MGLVLEMTALFREDTPRRLQEIRRTLSIGDAEAFSRTAHALKGGAGAIGARALRAQAAELGAAVLVGSTTVPEAALMQLDATYQDTLRALEAFASGDGR
jgi:HPt (histidine-containing phosphotransfer) domain-containing protein